jgi:hypothetical protein
MSVCFSMVYKERGKEEKRKGGRGGISALILIL